MDHVLTEHGLRLTYLCDSSAIEELDQDRILEDLSDDTPNGNPFPSMTRYHLADYDHLVLVTDHSSGRYLAFLGCKDGATARGEDFLLLESAFVATEARGQNLMRRMISLAMLRIGGIHGVPSVIAACTRNPVCYRIMHGMARRFTAAVFLPDPDSVVINFNTATLAQRIAREIGPNDRIRATTGIVKDDMLIAAGASRARPLARNPQFSGLFGQRMLSVLDLRGEDEAAILEDARRIYRSR
jgi:hypothetical protein